MPQRPDGAAARPQRVTFTKGSAERIAAVVRDYEAGDRGAEPLRFGTVATDARKTFRVATFTGAWSIGATKTVTFKYQTATPNTANVTNLFFPIVGTATSSVDCAIAKDGTAWYLIEWLEPTQQTASVTILTGVSLTTAGLQFTRSSVTVLASATLTITTIGTTAC